MVTRHDDTLHQCGAAWECTGCGLPPGQLHAADSGCDLAREDDCDCDL